MNRLLFTFLLYLILFFSGLNMLKAQCTYTVGTSATGNAYSAVVPTCDGTTYNFTIGGTNFLAGDLIFVDTEAGNIYTISLCGLVGWDTQITLFEVNSGAVVGNLDYNDDGCGFQSEITFTAPETTTDGVTATQYAVFVTSYNCVTNANTFSINITCDAPPPPLNVFTSCTGTIDYPNGNVNYGNNENVTWEICPSSSFDCLELDFTSFATESGWDFVNIFEGQGTTGTSLGTYTGGGPSFIIGATSPCVTIQFTSDGSSTANGFELNFNCTNNGTCPEPPLPIDIDDSFNDVDALVELFIGTCIEYRNATFTGDLQQIGYFSSGGTFGMTEGIIMSSGDVDNAEGPNDSGGNFTGLNVDSVDPDMETISGDDVWDCATLSFEFQPVSTSMSFDFLFASEEFPEYVNGGVNDAFGFFLSGPGINGTFSNSAINVANLPDGTPITIDDVFFTPYYNDNGGGSYIQYDGYTDVLTATYDNLQPCNGFYTLTLKLCDVGDDWLDSAVLLQANSFDAGVAADLTSIVPYSGTTDAYEGCDEGWFIITPDASSDFSQPITIDFSIDTSDPSIDYATYATDYTIVPTQGAITGTFPNFTLTIPAGEIADTLLINGFEDGIAEPFEDVTIQINAFQCDCSFPPPTSLNIQDVDWSEIVQLAPGITVCPDAQIPVLGLLDVTGTNPYGNYTFEVDDGTNIIATGANFFFLEFLNPPAGGWAAGSTTTYTVTFTDECGREIVSAYDVTIDAGPPDATISDPGPICESDGVVNFFSLVTSGGGTWSTSPACSPPCIDSNTGIFDPAEAVSQGIANPITISYDIPNAGCGADSDTQEISITASGDPTIIPPGQLCWDSENDGSTAILTAASTGGTWTATCGTCINSSTGELDLSTVTAGNYTFTYDLGTCGGSDSETITIENCCLGPVMFIRN